METSQARVEGKYLVIPTNVALPERCVRTNKVVTGKEYSVMNLPFLRRKVLLFIIFGPAALMFGPAITKNRCKVKVGLKKSIRWKYGLLQVFILMFMVIPFPLTAFYAVKLQSNQLVAVAGLMLFACYWIPPILYNFFAQPLKVVRMEDGLFWIKGCSQEFLTSFAKDLEAEA